MSHYFMDHEHKEKAKKLLGFKSVPFYVVLNKDGEMTQKGSSKQVDFEDIPGIIRPVDKENVKQTTVVEKKNVEAPVAAEQVEEKPVIAERVFTIDADFDFWIPIALFIGVENCLFTVHVFDSFLIRLSWRGERNRIIVCNPYE